MKWFILIGVISLLLITSCSMSTSMYSDILGAKEGCEIVCKDNCNLKCYCDDGIQMVYPVPQEPFCIQKASSDNWVRFRKGDCWCNYGVASECVKTVLYDCYREQKGYSGEIREEDCASQGLACINGRCVEGDLSYNDYYMVG